MRAKVAVVGFVLGLFCFSLRLPAQSERGSIRGTVEDPTGAVIAGANVAAINVGTGARTSAQTTEAGNYNIPQLPAGNYTVEIDHPGFKKLIQENVTVAVGGVAALNLRLDVGQATESVTVAAAAPQLKSETTDVSTAINPQSYNDLPLNAGGGRAPESFLFLAPGTSGSTFDAHINGSQTLSKEMQIDGMSTQIAEVQGDPRTLTFPPDAIQEMSVLTSGYPAEFGNTGGGVEQFVVKSGTNNLHGNLYEFLRNDKLDARGFFNASRSIHRENEFGGSVGGPVMIPKLYDGRNKSFFFTNINFYKLRGGAQNSIASVPNNAFRNGDLSGLRDASGNLIQIYDPATTRADGMGGFTRDPFVGNIIPPNRISQVSKNILATVPVSKTQDIFNNYPASGSSQTNNHNYTIKGDQSLGSNHRLNGVFNQGQNNDNGPYAALPHPVESSRDGHNTQNTVRLGYDWSISPTLLNHFGVGYNRQHQLLVAPETTVNWGQKLGISGINNGFPGISYGSFTALAQNQDRIEPVSNTFLYADSLSWTKGRHNMKFGADFRKLQHQGRYPSRSAAFGFSPNETAFPSGDLRGKTGLAFASFLLGQVDGSSEFINDVVSGTRWTYFAAYAQDDFKLSPKVTLNLGLRWDVFTPQQEVANRYSVMDPKAPNPKAGGLPGAYVFAGPGSAPHTGSSRLTSASDTDFKNFAPRLGIAWKITDRSVIRTAYGVSYYPTGAMAGGNSVDSIEGYSGNANFSSLDQGLHPAFLWDAGFPQNFDHPPFIDAGLNVNGSANIWWDNASKPMYRQDWNFGTQHQLTNSLVLDVGYVGAKATRLNTGAVNVNQVDPKYLSLGNLLTKDITDPSVVAAGFRPPYAGFAGSLAQALRPFPQYHGIGTKQSANIGNMTYHSLQAKAEKRFSHGLFFLTSYTWSKTLTDSNSALGGFFSPGARDNYNRRLEKALSVYDTPHRLVTAFNYELPIGPGKAFLNVKGPAGKVLQGWQVNGIVSYQSGHPIQIGVNNTLPLFNSGNTPNSVSGQAPELRSKSGFDPAKDLLLNINAFSIPAQGTFGTSARVLPNARDFPTYNEDFGIMKRTYIKENINFELRFEMFNAFNRVIFGGPATNINDANFGQVSSQANGPRNGQFAFKLNF